MFANERIDFCLMVVYEGQLHSKWRTSELFDALQKPDHLFVRARQGAI